MTTVFTHPVVPLTLGLVLGSKRIPRPLLMAGIVSSIFPDADCASFAMHIPYESQFGHRGFMHSIVFALALAALWAWRNMEFMKDGVGPKRWEIFLYIFISTVSHPLLDAMTDGGLGVALFWPFSTERFFFPWHKIPVSPIGGSFLSARGLEVLLAELKVVWLPCMAVVLTGMGLRRLLEKKAG